MHRSEGEMPASEAPEPDSTELFSRGASSIAPFAVETGHRTASQLAETCVVPRPAPRSQARGLVAAAIAIALLSLVSAVALRVPPAPPSVRELHSRRVVGAHEATMIPARTAPAKDLIDVAPDPSAAVPVSALPSSHRPPVPAGRASRLGLLRVSPQVKGILVDGAPHRVERGIVALACGTHTIKAPSEPARAVMVACAATTTL